MPIHSDIEESQLYFECHVTLEPVVGDRLALLERLSHVRGFRVATFLMQKDESTPDAFTSSRSRNYTDILTRMMLLIHNCADVGLIVKRYKIENTILDSKFEGDILKIVKQPAPLLHAKLDI